MIIEYSRRPVRPPVFLDQLAAHWVVDWNKKHPHTVQAVPETVPQETKLVLNLGQAMSIANTTHSTIPYRKPSGEAPKTIRSTPGLPVQFSEPLTSQKVNPGTYYRLTRPAEVDSRDKWWCGSRCGRDARTYGRKPRIERRIVGVCNFASSVSVREIRKAFAPLAVHYA